MRQSAKRNEQFQWIAFPRSARFCECVWDETSGQCARCRLGSPEHRVPAEQIVRDNKPKPEGLPLRKFAVSQHQKRARLAEHTLADGPAVHTVGFVARNCKRGESARTTRQTDGSRSPGQTRN